MGKQAPMVLMSSVIDSWTVAWKAFADRWRTLVGFQIVSGLVLTLVFTPLVHLFLQELVRAAGDSAVTNYDLVSFFFSVRGTLFLGVAGLAGLLSFRVQQAALLLLTAEYQSGPLTALRGVWRRRWALLQLTMTQLGFLFVLLIPLALVMFLVWHFLLGSQDINYYLHTKPPVWYAALTLAGIAGLFTGTVGIGLLTRWVYALPLLLRQGVSPWASLRRSVQTTRKNWVVPLVTIGGFWLLFWGVSNLFSVLVIGLGRGVLLAVGERLALAVFVVLGVFGFLSVAALFTGTVGPLLGWILVNRLYGHAFAVGHSPSPQSTGKEEWAFRRTAIGVAWGALVVVSVTGAWWLKRLDFSPPVQITAHRGSSALAPENTLSALRLAIQDGADFSEIDVQTTRDGVVVLLHDRDLMRMARDPRRLESLSLEELRSIDVGSPFGEAFRGERVPTLAEALDLVRGRMGLNIELKYNRPDPTLAPRVIDLLRGKGMIDQCVITSLDLDALRQAEALEPRVVTGLIVTKSLGDPTRLGVNFLSLNVEAATRRLVWRARRHGLAVHVWTVNDAALFERMADRGVDVVITDHPAQLSALRQTRGALSPPELIALRLRRLLL
jgi:glycerophosphoryl diester phosphodiesterase